jgi:hypothetical protein
LCRGKMFLKRGSMKNERNANEDGILKRKKEI